MKRVLIGGFLMLIGTIWGSCNLYFLRNEPDERMVDTAGQIFDNGFRNRHDAAVCVSYCVYRAGICDFRERVFYERRKVKEFSKTEKQLSV